MHERYQKSRTPAVTLALLLLVSTTILLPGPAQAATLFTDEFETGPAGWTTQYGTGTTQDCTVKWGGTCSLRVTSTDASGVCITKSASVSMSGVTTVSWYIRPSSTSAVDDSTSLGWGYNDGGGVTGIHYDGAGSYGGTLYVADTWPGLALDNSDVWYKVAVEIRPGLDTFHARLYNAAGTLLTTTGESSGMAATSTSITSFRICGRGIRDNYDTLKVDVDGTAPSVPQSVLAATTGYPSELKVTWNAPLTSGHPSFGIDHYNVWRASTSTGTYDLMDVVYVNEPREYFDYGLPTGTTYYYKVSAVAAGGESTRSAASSATTPNVPGVPINPGAVSGPGVGELRLTWSAPASNGGLPITSYNVYRSSTIGGTYNYLTSPSGTSYTDGSLANGATWYYKIQAVNDVGGGSFTNAVFATTFDVPSAPTNLNAVKGTNPGEVILSWQAPSQNGGTSVTSYKVYRSDSPTGTFQHVGTSTSTSKTDSGLANSATVYYRVSAINAVGESAQSATATGFTLRVPTAPQNLQATPAPDSIFLHWEPPTDMGDRPIENYRVYRGTASAGKLQRANDPTGTVYAEFVTAGVLYYYEVTAFSGVGESPRSNEVTAMAYGVTSQDEPGTRTLVNIQNATLGGYGSTLDGLTPNNDPVTGHPLPQPSEPIALVVYDSQTAPETCADLAVPWLPGPSGEQLVNVGCWSNQVPGDASVPRGRTPLGVPSEGVKVTLHAAYHFVPEKLWKVAGVAGDTVKVYAPVAAGDAGWWTGPAGAQAGLVIKIGLYKDATTLDYREIVIPHVGQALAASEYMAGSQS